MNQTTTQEEQSIQPSFDKAIAELIYQSCDMLDKMDFAGYVELCAPAYQYKITAYSPELKKDMVWQDVNLEALKHHFDLIGRHVREIVNLTRFPTVYSIKYEADGKRAQVVTGLQVFKTKLDGGETALYGIGKIYDTICLNTGRPRLRSREIRMETRQLGTGSQIPF